MSKRQLGGGRKAMTRIKNSLTKCLCGSYFDQDGVCANGHLQDEEFFVPGIKLSNDEVKDDKSLTEPGVCDPFGNRCNICGSYIPEGDNVCDHGHVIGVKYSDN